MSLSYKLFIFLSISSVILAGCRQPDNAELDRTSDPASTSQAFLELVLETPVQTPSATQTPDDLSGAETRLLILQIAPESQAAYTVQEELLGVGFPTDVLGITEDVTGVIILDGNGNISGNDSLIKVDLRTLNTGEDRRDNYVRRNTLETSLYPFARFVPKTVSNLPIPLPTIGTLSFSIHGEMTLHGVTEGTIWDVNATFSNEEIFGLATTEFQFATFGLAQPQVRRVLGVEDKIRLQINLRLIVMDE